MTVYFINTMKWKKISFIIIIIIIIIFFKWCFFDAFYNCY